METSRCQCYAGTEKGKEKPSSDNCSCIYTIWFQQGQEVLLLASCRTPVSAPFLHSQHHDKQGFLNLQSAARHMKVTPHSGSLWGPWLTSQIRACCGHQQISGLSWRAPGSVPSSHTCCPQALSGLVGVQHAHCILGSTFEVGEGGHLRDVVDKDHSMHVAVVVLHHALAEAFWPAVSHTWTWKIQKTDIWVKRKHEIEIGENMVLWHYKNGEGKPDTGSGSLTNWQNGLFQSRSFFQHVLSLS